MEPVQRDSGPYGFLYLNPLVMQDSDGIYWTVGVNADGEIETEVGGTFQQCAEQILLNDTDGRTWPITISTEGVLPTV